MNILIQTQRYLLHEISTRFYAVKLYRSSQSVAFVCRRYHISKSSLMRWNKKFDGSRESLADHSHKPKTPHSSSHTPKELKWIRDLYRRNPHASVCEIYGKLRSSKGYRRHPASLYRVCARLGYTKQKVKPTNKYTNQVIQTDNGAEFTYPKDYNKLHPMDKLCEQFGIMHKLIRPRTLRHNGKVERSHRLDQERFYNFLRCSPT